MYIITKYFDTTSGIISEISTWSDKDTALNIFASLIQEHLYFLDEVEFFWPFIDRHTEANYSLPIESITDYNWCLLSMGTFPEGMISVNFFNGDTDVIRFQLVEYTNGLSITL